MPRRRASTTAFSLFSFQDIITSVTGIMVLVTLILALDLLDRTKRSPAVQTQQITAESEATISELEREIESLRARVSAGVATVADLPSLDERTLSDLVQDAKGNADHIARDTASKNDQASRKQAQLEAAKTADAKDKDNDDKTLEDLEKMVDDLTVKLESIESDDRLFFKEGVSGKTCWIVEINDGNIQTAQIGVSAQPRRFDNINSFRAWLTSLNNRKDALYMVIKPGGGPLFEESRKVVTAVHFDFGFTVEPKGRTILDPKTGAGTP